MPAAHDQNIIYNSVYRFLIHTIFFALISFFGNTPLANAQYFRNHAVQIPSLGWIGFDNTFSALHPTPWGFSDQFALGLGYMHAIHFQTYWLAETQVGLGRDQLPDFKPNGIASLNIATGIRHNFLSQRFRPFLAAYIHYLQFFTRSIPEKDQYRIQADLPNSGSIWVGLRPGFGLEWFFGEEMSVQAEVGYLALFHIDYLFRHSFTGNVSYHLYF